MTELPLSPKRPAREDEASISIDIERPLAAGRRILWTGFASILALMAVIGVDVARSLQTAAEKNTALMKQFRERDQILDELRNAVIRSGSTIRDYLSETDESRGATLRVELEGTRTRTEELLEVYDRQEGPVDAEQRQAFDDLKAGVGAYWKSLAPVLGWDAATRRLKGAAYRQDAIGPLRAEVLQLSLAITRINERQLDAGEQAIQEEYSSLRSRLIVASGLALAIGCALAVFATRRNQRLERAAEAQYRTVEQARRELRELAERLDTAQEEERKRLARELHDEVGQSMSALLVELGRLEAILPASGDPALKERAKSVRAQAEASVRSVRDMALLLRPSMLDDLGLVAALKWQGREVARRTGLRVRVEAEDTGDQLPDSHRTCVYRVVQEALQNCAKHARAQVAKVTLRQVSDMLEVEVCDDGAGFDPATEKGLGLLGMEERVRRLKGSFHLESAPGKGTAVLVRLPAPVERLESVSS